MKQSQHTRVVLAETLPGRRAAMGQCLAAQPRGDGPGASEDAPPASAMGVCPAVRDAGISRAAQDLRTSSPMQTILHDAANADNPMQTINESREPRAESREPRAESREPRAESREPRAESREPRAESREREPRAESREPRAESREPRAESREPRAESREPRAEFIPPAGMHHAPAERSSYHPPGCTMSASRTAGPVRPPEPSRHPRGASARQDRPAPPPFDRGAPPSPNPASPAASAPRPAPLLRRTSLRRRFRPWENAVALLCSISDAIARRATVALPRGTAGAACLIALAWLASPGAQAQTQTETTFISNIGRSATTAAIFCSRHIVHDGRRPLPLVERRPLFGETQAGLPHGSRFTRTTLPTASRATGW